MVTFEVLKPDNLLGTVHDGLTMGKVFNHLFKIPETNINVSNQEGLAYNLSAYILVFIGFVMAVILIFLLSKVRSLQKRMMKTLRSIKDKTIWNNTIRRVSLSYL